MARSLPFLMTGLWTVFLLSCFIPIRCFGFEHFRNLEEKLGKFRRKKIGTTLAHQQSDRGLNASEKMLNERKG